MPERDAGADEDRRDHEETGSFLAPGAAKEEGNPEGERGEGVAEVVDQVGEEGDAAAQQVDEDLHERRQHEDGKADRDCLDARA